MTEVKNELDEVCVYCNGEKEIIVQSSMTKYPCLVCMANGEEIDAEEFEDDAILA